MWPGSSGTRTVGCWPGLRKSASKEAFRLDGKRLRLEATSCDVGKSRPGLPAGIIFRPDKGIKAPSNWGSADRPSIADNKADAHRRGSLMLFIAYVSVATKPMSVNGQADHGRGFGGAGQRHGAAPRCPVECVPSPGAGGREGLRPGRWYPVR